MEDFINMPTQGNVVPRDPNTEIILCMGIGWDSDYEHVRFFNNEPELLEHVKSKCPSLYASPYHITQVTPISGGKMRVRIPEMESKLMDLNYLAYNNKGFIDRWFYAFITNLQWLSDNSCVIEFELDIFQNCAYRVNYNSCFINREHIAKSADVIGSNVIPENLETGEFRDNYIYYQSFGDNGIGVLVTERLDGTQCDGKMIGNVYQGADFIIFNDDELKAYEYVNGLISNYNDKGKLSAIVNVFMVPRLCWEAKSETTTVYSEKAFSGYRPKNNKLYTHPYCYCLVDNNSGDTGLFKFELSSQPDRINFQCVGSTSPLAGVHIRTIDYNTQGLNELCSLNYIGFPQCSWNSDVYKAYTAQNKNMIAFQAGNNALKPLVSGGQGAILGALTGGGVGATLSGVGGVVTGAVSGFMSQAEMMASHMDKEIEPAQIHGKGLCLNLNASMELQRIDYHVMSCTMDNAKAIDDFFTAYGYATNRLKPPNLNTRPYWNFIKTSGCSFTGDLPTDMLKGFRSIFNRGVTLWHTNDIGNYGLDNQ